MDIAPRAHSPNTQRAWSCKRRKPERDTREHPESVSFQYSRNALVSTGFLQFYKVCWCPFKKFSSCLKKTKKQRLMNRTVLWTLWERERVGRFGRIALKHVKYHVWNELPVQVRCTILDAWGKCTGTTQWDGMGREEGGGCKMGNTCIPVADSFWYLAKLIQLCKV